MKTSVYLVFYGGEAIFFGAYSTRKNAEDFIESGWAQHPKEGMRIEAHILDKLLDPAEKPEWAR